MLISKNQVTRKIINFEMGHLYRFQYIIQKQNIKLSATYEMMTFNFFPKNH